MVAGISKVDATCSLIDDQLSGRDTDGALIVNNEIDQGFSLKTLQTAELYFHSATGIADICFYEACIGAALSSVVLINIGNKSF